MSRCLLSALAVVLFATFSVAQSDHVEVFGGYSYLNSDFTSSVSNGVSGWNVSGTVKLVRYAGIVADFSGFSPSGGNPCPSCGGGPFAHYHMYLGGPQVSMSFGNIKPFARFLAGVTQGSLTHSDSQFGGNFDNVTVGAGGGVDFGFNRWSAFRVQADWLHIATFSANVARASVGLVFRF